MIDWNKLTKSETVEEQKRRVGSGDWRVVLNELLSPVSEIAQIILVNRQEDLPRVAAFFIEPRIDDDTDTIGLMNEFK